MDSMNSDFDIFLLELCRSEEPQIRVDNTASTSNQKDPQSILHLKVELKGPKPSIWRKLLVSKYDTFEQLHYYIQNAMGWGSYHRHDFVTQDKIRIMERYNEAATDVLSLGLKEHEIILNQFLSQPKSRVTYTYDFGSCWVHTVTVLKVTEPVATTKYPICVGGKRACPPEECGGMEGYQNLLKIRRNPHHPLYKNLITDWLYVQVPEFDPEVFVLNKDIGEMGIFSELA